MDEKILKLKPKTRAVLDYISIGNGATVREAQDALGMTEVRSRISEIGKAGIPVKKTWETGANKYGEPVRFLRYAVIKEGGND